MIPAQPRTVIDSSGITLETAEIVPGASIHASASPPHTHPFYELALAMRGSAIYQFRHRRIALVPGDLLLLPPELPHLCHPQNDILLYLCHFESWAVPDKILLSGSPEPDGAAQQRLHILDAFSELPDQQTEEWLHLNKAECEHFHALFRALLMEQQNQPFHFEQMKRLHLQEILILFQRMQYQQSALGQAHVSWKKSLVETVLTQIEADLSKGVDFEAISRQQGITLSYFREIFKEITGLTPVHYLNQARIMRALELLQTGDLSIAETGQAVGIDDANYFSRLFKKVTGYPPRYFKGIADSADKHSLLP